MSETAKKLKQAAPEIREAEAPESTIREIRTQLHMPDPAYDFYDELTEPLWNPPLLEPVHPTLDAESRLEELPVPGPPVISMWKWMWLALTGS